MLVQVCNKAIVKYDGIVRKFENRVRTYLAPKVDGGENYKQTLRAYSGGKAKGTSG